MAHKLDSEKKLWERAAAFHGHVCPGLTIGYRAALYAIDLLGLTFRTMNRSCVLRKMMPAALMRFKQFLDAASEREIYCSICAANRHFRSIIGKPESLSALS